MCYAALNKIKRLLKKPCFTAAEARASGVSPSLLTYYAKKGEIEKLSRGVYRGNESAGNHIPFEWQDLISTAESIPNGKICLISALALYELSAEIPRQFWIAVPHKQFAPRRPKTKIIRMRDIKTGSTRLKLGAVAVRIFDKERTIVDSFRLLAPETAIKALKEYLSGKHGKPNLVKLRQYARKLKVPLEKYVEAFTT